MTKTKTQAVISFLCFYCVYFV